MHTGQPGNGNQLENHENPGEAHAGSGHDLQEPGAIPVPPGGDQGKDANHQKRTENGLDKARFPTPRIFSQPRSSSAAIARNISPA